MRFHPHIPQYNNFSPRGVSNHSRPECLKYPAVERLTGRLWWGPCTPLQCCTPWPSSWRPATGGGRQTVRGRPALTPVRSKERTSLSITWGGGRLRHRAHLTAGHREADVKWHTANVYYILCIYIYIIWLDCDICDLLLVGHIYFVFISTSAGKILL